MRESGNVVSMWELTPTTRAAGKVQCKNCEKDRGDWGFGWGNRTDLRGAAESSEGFWGGGVGSGAPWRREREFPGAIQALRRPRTCNSPGWRSNSRKPSLFCAPELALVSGRRAASRFERPAGESAS